MTNNWETRADRQVVVEAPARLHLGFMNPNGRQGRRFGGLGLTIDGIATRLVVKRSGGFDGDGPKAERALRCARHIFDTLELPGAVDIRVESAIPEHVGLGSGTQLSLAVGTAIAELYELELSARGIGRLAARGERSGIGLGAFEMGGLLIDGGRTRDGDMPPMIARHDLPPEWRIILIFDARGEGLHGEQEVAAFKELPPFPETAAARLCYLVLMRILPGLLERDMEEFGSAISELQRAVGDYFAPVQGGRFTSSAVGQALMWMEAQGVAGVGQSSWGPTGFALIENEDKATDLLNGVRAKFGELSRLQFQVVKPRNHGATVQFVENTGRARRAN